MTGEARRCLEECQVIVGYTVYLDLLRESFPEKIYLSTPMRKEEARCRMAFEEAEKGRKTAMVCSGDPGVYGMAGLMYQVGRDYPKVEIQVIPGVTAALGGSALLGAPLGHDFCVISLSDLLTPWEVIEKRLEAAAEADFVLCFYNPASRTRKDHLARACRILLRYRSPETLCGLARNIGREGEEIRDYLYDIWNTMKQSVSDGLTRTGELPGGLEVERKAQYLYNRRHIDESPQTRENRLVCAYAFAVAEQNASGGEIVTAPTCGASGVMPAALLYMQEERGFSDEAIVRALAAGGVIGDLIKTNASISGAECGCQAEIGSACSMTAAALGELFEMGLGQIGYAAEVAMEHHLGLTCDPIGGLVQIPCIERNAVAAMRAINALSLANFLSETSKISFDTVVHTMYETGRDLNRVYRETAEGGLAKHYRHS